MELRDDRPTPSPGADPLPGPLAGTADPVLFLLLVEAATFADAVFPVHNLTFGVEEGEWRAATYAELLGELLVLGESGTLLTRFLTHLTGNHPCRGGGETENSRSGERVFYSGMHSLLLPPELSYATKT